MNRKVSVFNVVQARVESNVPHRFPAKQLVPCHAVFVLRPKVCSPEVIVPCQFLRRVAALCRAVCLRKVEMFFRPLRKIAQHQICTVCLRRFRQPFIHQGADVVVGVNESDPVPRRMVNADIPRVGQPAYLRGDRFYPAISGRQRFQYLPCIVRRSVFDGNDLNIPERAPGNGVDAPLDVRRTIVHRHNNAYHSVPPCQNGRFRYLQFISFTYHLSFDFSGAAPLHGVCARFSQYSAFNGCLQSLHHGLLVKLGV